MSSLHYSCPRIHKLEFNQIAPSASPIPLPHHHTCRNFFFFSNLIPSLFLYITTIFTLNAPHHHNPREPLFPLQNEHHSNFRIRTARTHRKARYLQDQRPRQTRSHHHSHHRKILPSPDGEPECSEQVFGRQNIPGIGEQAVCDVVRPHRSSAEREFPRNLSPPINLRRYPDQRQEESRSRLFSSPWPSGPPLLGHLRPFSFHRRCVWEAQVREQARLPVGAREEERD